MQNGFKLKNYTLNYLLLVLGAVFVVLLVASVSCYQIYSSRFNQEAEFGEQLAQKISLGIELWFSKQVSTAKVIANFPLVKELCENPQNKNMRKDVAGFIESIHKQHNEYSVIGLVSFFDDPNFFELSNGQGIIHKIKKGSIFLDSVDGKSYGAIDFNSNYVKGIYKGDQVYISEAKPDVVSDFSSAVIVAVPIHGEGNKLLGAVFIGINFESFINTFYKNTRVGKTGWIEIIDSRGLYVTSRDRNNVLREAEPSISVELLEKINRGVANFYLDVDDKMFIYSASKINLPYVKATEWWVVFKREYKEILQPVIFPMFIMLSLCLLGLASLLFFIRKVQEIAHVQYQYKEASKDLEIYHLYTQGVSYGVALLDSKLNFVDINQAVENMLGYQTQDLHGKHVAAVLSSPEQVLAAVFEVLQCKKQIQILNVPLIHKNKEVVLVDINIGMFGTNKHEGAVLLTLTPIPESRDYEACMQAIYSVSLDSYVTIDDNYNLTNCSDSCLKLFKAGSKQEVIDNFFKYSPRFQACGRLTSELYLEKMEDAFKHGLSKFNWLHQDSEENSIPCEIILVHFMQKGRKTIVACMRDLREQYKNEAALMKERAILRSVIDNIQPIIFLRDAQERFVIVNKSYEKIIGVREEDIVGKTELEILPSELVSFCRSTDKLACEAKGSYYFEQVLTMADGSQRDYLFSKDALYTAYGKFDGILSLGVDVTRLKEAERQIEVAKIKAEEANLAKNDFMARMSHEIRTPMNAIMGMSFLCMQTELTEKQMNYLDKIKSSADHLMGILNSILDFSKIESGKMGSEEIPFNLSQVVTRVKDVLSVRAVQADIGFEINLDEGVPQHLLGDPIQLQQILINLGSNSIKFTSKGKIKINISCKRIVEDRVCLSLVVQDTGIGMSKEQMQHLFEPFTQASNSTARLYGGTGLGLAISKSLVELMEGSIWAESQEGVGTTFYALVWLKQDKSGGDDQAQIEFEDEVRLHGCKILLVDDNEINQEIACEILSSMGADIEMASNGQEAVEAVCNKNYDLIFMDIQMPVMDGIEAVKKIRASGVFNTSTVPVIAMTANVMLSDRKKSFEAGMNDYIIKPIEIKELKKILTRWLFS